MLGNYGSGLVAIAVGGVSNGSFPVPSKRITTWEWEHIWLVYSLFAMAVLPVGLALLFAPEIISQTLPRDLVLAVKVGLCGLIWGAGSVLFGLSIKRLGLAIANAMVSGVVVFMGSVGPILIGAVHIDIRHFLWLVLGLALLVLSLILCAWASISRDRSQQPPSTKSGPATNSGVAVFLAILSGILSSVLNIGFASGARLIQHARVDGSPHVLTSLAVWIPGLLGGLVFNMGYPAYRIVRGGMLSSFVSGRQSLSCWSRSSFMGVLWFGNILLYGYGAELMGSAGPVYGWALNSAVAIVTSNIWGAVTGEWKGAKLKPKTLMLISILLLISSFIVLVVKRLPN
jgi:L-rhamnose-H+ transport protein